MSRNGFQKASTERGFGEQVTKHAYLCSAFSGKLEKDGSKSRAKTECVLPKYQNVTASEEQSFDLVHVRDVIQHLTLDQGVKYFCHVFKSGAKVLITTTYVTRVGGITIT